MARHNPASSVFIVAARTGKDRDASRDVPSTSGLRAQSALRKGLGLEPSRTLAASPGAHQTSSVVATTRRA